MKLQSLEHNNLSNRHIPSGRGDKPASLLKLSPNKTVLGQELPTFIYFTMYMTLVFSVYIYFTWLTHLLFNQHATSDFNVLQKDYSITFTG